jgi:hypothetical protein
MKKLLTRGLLGVAALTVPMGASLALPMAAAHAAPATSTFVAHDGVTYGGDNGVIVSYDGGQTFVNGTNGVINGNLDVPAGVTATLAWTEVTGNVSVEGNLNVRGNTTFDHNLSVNGGSFKYGNQWLHIAGNVSFINSPGPSNDQNGFWDGPNTVGGNFSYTYSSGRLYVGNLTVNGNFTFANNTGGSDLGGLIVMGHKNVS